MAYDSREYLKALQQPKFIAADGKEHLGRILSHHERAVAQTALLELSNTEKPTMVDSEKCFRSVLATMFEAEGVDAIMALPPEAVEAAMLDFLACQRPPKKEERKLALVDEEPPAAPMVAQATPAGS